jgi:hypothetical protein
MLLAERRHGYDVGRHEESALRGAQLRMLKQRSFFALQSRDMTRRLLLAPIGSCPATQDFKQRRREHQCEYRIEELIGRAHRTPGAAQV